MKKFLKTLMAICICVMCIGTTAYAGDFETETNQTRAHDKEYKRVRTGFERETVDFGEVPGQKREGIRFENGGAVYWQDKGSPVTITISAAGKIGGVGITPGEIDYDHTEGYAVTIPGDGWFYKVGVKRTVLLEVFDVYSRFNGTGDAWMYDKTVTETTILDTDCYLIPVKKG